MYGTLVVDEFDASIHPIALMSIINIFHNDEINVHGAQETFDTYTNLFGRDEIKFAERDDFTRRTEIWHTSDYESSEDIHVRQFPEPMDNMRATLENRLHINLDTAISRLICR